MSLREELVDYFPEEEVEELFSGCCMLYDVVGVLREIRNSWAEVKLRRIYVLQLLSC